MARVLLILGVVAAVLWIFSIVDCAVQPDTRHRGVSKPTWIVIVVVLPVIGGLLWFTIGRGRPGQARSVAPDDDPSFLGSIGSIPDQDERIRRIEEELAQLDAEDDASSKRDQRGDGPAQRGDGSHTGRDDPDPHRDDDSRGGRRGAA